MRPPIPDVVWLCSTPDGIKGFLTARAEMPKIKLAGAQRLTASKDSSRGKLLGGFAIVSLCSTPDGIKGFLTESGGMH